MKIEDLFEDKPFYESNYQYCLYLGLDDNEISSAVASASYDDISELDRASVAWVWERSIKTIVKKGGEL